MIQRLRDVLSERRQYNDVLELRPAMLATDSIPINEYNNLVISGEQLYEC